MYLNKDRRGRLLGTTARAAITALVGLLFAHPALAQTEATQADEDEVKGEEILVTAQKRSQRLQDVPIAVTTFGERELRAIGATNVNDIALRTPGLKFGNFSDLKGSTTTIRGVFGGSYSAGVDPSVGTYLNEVYLGGGIGANIDYFDISRVEVLRGPQGTLFGRNSLAGVVNITTNKPSNNLEAYVDAEYGNYDYIRLTGALSGPLVKDKIAARVAAAYTDRDGFIRNETLDERGDGQHSYALRGQILLTPTPETEFLLEADYRDVDQKSKYYETTRYNPASLLYQMLVLRGLPRNTDPDDRKIFSDSSSRESLKAWSTNLNARFDLGGVELTSITAYREHDYDNIQDTDESPLRFLFNGDPEKVWRASEELRLASTGDRPLNWIVGAYYYRQHSNNRNFVHFAEDLTQLFPPNLRLYVKAGAHGVLDLDSYAAFAHVDYDLSEKLELAIGARFTHETRAIVYNQTDPLGQLGGSVQDLRAKDDWDSFTPNVTLQYRANPDLMLYASASSGFKSGGYNDALGSANGLSFGPEKAWNYELGLKSSWLDRRVTFNAAAFYVRWNDIQILHNDPDTPAYDPTIRNAGKAYSYGAEVELNANVSDRLRIGINGALTKAEYRKGSLPTPSGNVSLTRLPFSPDYRLNLNVEYAVPLASLGKLAVRAEYLRQGDMQLASTGGDLTEEDAYGLLNGRISLIGSGDRWSISLWGRNLGNTLYRERVFDLYSQALVGQTFAVYGQPRTFGLQARLGI